MTYKRQKNSGYNAWIRNISDEINRAKMQIKRNILLNPGPATTTDSVKMAMVVPDICPREQEFVHLMKEVRRGILKVVHAGNDYVSVLFGGSGTAAMDAVINSVVSPRKKMLIINNGAYGERIEKIARTYNIEYIELRTQWTKTIDARKVEKALAEDSQITHVAMVHHETTTGLLNPLGEIGQLVRSYGRCFIVDAISSFGGIDIDVQKDCIDYLIAVSNKCIQGMPGVSFVICKRNEIEKLNDYQPRSFYLNLYQQYKHFETKGEMQFTPPVQVIYALKQALDEYFKEGGSQRFKRYRNNHDVLIMGLERLGFRLLIDKSARSYLLTTIIEPDHPNYDFHLMHDLLLQKGFTIYPGKLGKKATFRVANMGDINSQDMEAFIQALEATMITMHVALK